MSSTAVLYDEDTSWRGQEYWRGGDYDQGWHGWESTYEDDANIWAHGWDEEAAWSEAPWAIEPRQWAEEDEYDANREDEIVTEEVAQEIWAQMSYPAARKALNQHRLARGW
eukprot:4621904-Amphidinium_carterae.1